MTDAECRMTKEARSPNDQEAGETPLSFDLSSFPLRGLSLGFAVFIVFASYGWAAHARHEMDPTPHKLICGFEFASDLVNPFRRSVSIERETPDHPIRTY
jgi:hypothetical protein